MAIYVDRIRDHGDAVTGRAKRVSSRWCHLMADTEEDLHAFAERIGMKRDWAQEPGTHRSHYDLTPKRRALAVSLGAVETTSRELVKLRKKKINERP